MENKFDLKFNATYTSISKYVDSLYDGFIPSVVGKIRTLDFVTLVPDVAYTKVIPTVNTTLDLVDASSCTTFANGATAAITGVTLTTCFKKAEESFCINEMSQYWAGQYMRSGDYKSLPFEQSFVDEYAGKIAKKLDQIFWQGDSCVTGVMAGATAGGATWIGTQSFSTSTAITNGIIYTFDNMINYLATANSDMLSEDLVIAVGQDAFDVYTRSIRNLNLYHFSPDEINGASVKLFGKRNVTLFATVGLNGTNKAMLYKPEFVFWGTDIAPVDGKPIDGEYSFYLNKYLLRFQVKIGAAIAFPASSVVATLTSSFNTTV
jgi:hypothetical protein